MKVCTKCRHKGWSTDKFCTKCGNTSFVDITKYCPECGSVIISGDWFCGQCGRVLVKPMPHVAWAFAQLFGRKKV
jgi:uncharacterized membrane protein YvbJ